MVTSNNQSQGDDDYEGRVISPHRAKTRVDIDVEKLGDLTPSSKKETRRKHGGEGGSKDDDEADNDRRTGRVPLTGYAALVSALLALSSLGAALKLQGPGVTPTMKAYWRMVATAIALGPIAGRSVVRDGWPRLTSDQKLRFALCAAGYATMTGSFAVALSMSSMAETFILGNTAGLVIIAGKIVTRMPVSLEEGLGVAIGFLGGVVCADDSPNEKENDRDLPSAEAIARHEQYHPVKGGLIAFLASCGLAVYLTLAKDLRPHMDLFLFMMCVMTAASSYLLLFMFLSGEELSLSNHHEHGLWGWTNLSRDRLPLEIHLVVVCNFIGTTGYVACMKYFDAVVVSTVMLMEPLTATLIGAAAGVEELPGIQTWVGGAIVSVGSLLVIFAGARKAEVKPHTQ